MILSCTKIHVTIAPYTEFKIFVNQSGKLLNVEVWKYEQGNYDLLRQIATETNLNSLRHNDINIYAQNIKEYILSLIDSCIPNKVETIRPFDLPWITCYNKTNAETEQSLSQSKTDR